MLDRPADADDDPLSQVVALLRPRTALSASLEAGGAWCLRFPASPTTIKFLAVESGGCWMRREGEPERQLRTGDCFLMTRGAPYVLASDLALPERDARELYAVARDGRARQGSGDGVTVRGGRFDFEASHAALLLDMLPPVVHVAATSEAAAVIRWALVQLAGESNGAKAGTTLMRSHLAQVLLLQILRTHLASQDGQGTGWIAALADRQIGPVVARLHGDPAARWTLAELAGLAAMSRSGFAARFKSLVGLPPLDYLMRLRMLQAARALREGGSSVATVAVSLGYDSDSAFSHAFKRVMGSSPSAWRARSQA
ncbi:AraC family transcriptional regulator [Paucibacter sp. R3-3]|uniref:AraC family transcriptional regulator n=1 Tax=Roseateles agri TaxID=3098619 RepID=A0ABU5DJY3_9BURK|nr:AraC family transcriptional regulator [Paucibacter sp. R3-3]MDY0746603.1 AraC family transcriptional regulator [Paucibacter sp. R3-3]